MGPKIQKRKCEPEPDEDEEENEDELLQELFAAGKLKPGLNIPVPIKNYANNVEQLNATYDKLKLNLPWIERLDLINDMATLAPELCMEIKEQEQFVESGRSSHLALNEFKRETLFHRQAQLAAIEGIKRLRSLGVPTVRPPDYFAEMMKSDEHMQKVRRSLLQRQAGLERSEKIKKIRLEKKLAKQKRTETVLRKQKEKRSLNEEIKKYRKGARTDLDFLDNKPSQKNNSKRLPNKKRQRKNEKFGFGGRKGNNEQSDFDGKKKSNKKTDFSGKRKGKFKSGSAKKKRPGKSKRKNVSKKR